LATKQDLSELREDLARAQEEVAHDIEGLKQEVTLIRAEIGIASTRTKHDVARWALTAVAVLAALIIGTAFHRAAHRLAAMLGWEATLVTVAERMRCSKCDTRGLCANSTQVLRKPRRWNPAEIRWLSFNRASEGKLCEPKQQVHVALAHLVNVRQLDRSEAF
jgi:hypothetical protein